MPNSFVPLIFFIISWNNQKDQFNITWDNHIYHEAAFSFSFSFFWEGGSRGISIKILAVNIF
jgi:hypothetical protein